MKKVFKNTVTAGILFAVILSLVPVSDAASTSNVLSLFGVSIEQVPSKVDGKITLTGESNHDKLLILVTMGEKKHWYDVKLDNGKFKEEIWLIEGKGRYEISVLIHQSGRQYMFGPKVYVDNATEVNRFLVPTKHVESNNEEIINLANEITRYVKTDRAKAKVIYRWVVRNIKYDYGKYIKQLNKDFDNDYGALNTLKTGMGVCYDYATLVAALGRAVGLQVKVVKGNFVSPYRQELHAWNEIYISEDDEWISVDTTFAYALNKNYFDNVDFNEDHEKISEY